MARFAGVYWSERKETRQEAARRIEQFLSGLPEIDRGLSSWYFKGRSRRAALKRPAPIDARTLAASLRVQRTDTDGEIIEDLGFSISLWNGEDASFSATVGAYSPYVGNCAVLDTDANLSKRTWRQLLEHMIQAFEPEHGVVTSHEQLDRVGAAEPWDAGWFIYTRGDRVREHPIS